jgi:hypothetical protein
VELPIEVFGPEGASATRTLRLAGEAARDAAYLALRVNNLGYEGKGSVQLNDGAVVVFDHASVEVEPDALARGGMAHGGVNTLWIRVPLAPGALQAGENTLTLRFELGNGLSNGFRVVDLELETAEGAGLLPPWATYEVDPATWTPPIAGADAAARGRELWYGAALWSHDLPAGRTGFWYDKVIGERREIRATCSDCHTQDGRDLELFSYSNASIIDRARFHGLSQEQGEQIAAYIRSLSGPSGPGNVGRWGRPWNPPFQPGPAVATLPPERWPAGAGLDAVLATDADMAPYMFGPTITAESVRAHLDPAAMVDRTTLPLALQLPDWKHWLPMVHPIDAYNAGGWYDDLAAAHDGDCRGGGGCTVSPTAAYARLREFVEAQPPEDRPIADLQWELQSYWYAHRAFFAMGTQWQHWRSKGGDANTVGLGANATFADMEFAATSLARLMAVKYFEVHHEFDLADKAQVLLGVPEDQVPARQWFGEDYQVFEIPPHFTACFDPARPRDKDCSRFTGQALTTGKFESTSWYHLQSIVNGGNGQIRHNSPVDYNYQQDHTLEAAWRSGIVEPLRMVHQLNTMYQTRTWSGGMSPNDGRGFRIRVMGPWVFYGIGQSGELNGWDVGDVPAQLDAIRPGLQKWVLDGFVQAFLDEMDAPHNALSGWDRVAPHGSDNALDPASKTMADLIPLDDPDFVFIGGRWADKYYAVLPWFAASGVECSLMQRYVDWGERAWPRLDWAAARATIRATAALHLTAAGVELVVGSPGAAPMISWTVDGQPVAASGTVLPATQFGAGAVVEATVVSDDPCLAAGRRTASATLQVP